MSDYKPRGKVVPLLQAAKDDPMRVFTVPEAAALTKMHPAGVMAMLAYAMRAGAIYRGKDAGGRTVLRGTEFPPGQAHEYAPKRKRSGCCWMPSPDDIRIPRVVPNWRPPVMVAPRAGSSR